MPLQFTVRSFNTQFIYVRLQRSSSPYGKHYKRNWDVPHRGGISDSNCVSCLECFRNMNKNHVRVTKLTSIAGTQTIMEVYLLHNSGTYSWLIMEYKSCSYAVTKITTQVLLQLTSMNCKYTKQSWSYTCNHSSLLNTVA